MKINNFTKLLLSILPPLAVGAIAGFFTSKAIPGWYASLNQPSFNPPNWIFGPVWTTLYILMGISLFIIWQLPSTEIRKQSIRIYWIQLILNFIWSFLFFYFKNIGLALIEIVILWLSIILMLRLFYQAKPMASYLNLPYILWVSFATALNISYYILNN